MPGPATRGIGRTLLPAIEDEESLMNRSLLGPGQVTKNLLGSAVSAAVGFPGDMEQLGRGIINMRAGVPVVKPEPKLPNTERMQGLLGVEPGRPESLLGEIGAPDPTDLGRVGGRGLLGMTLFHGTPHKFDMFDMRKIGTGEGAQAYGHGLYFAESPEVAGNYRTALSYDPDKMKIGGKQINEYYRQLDESAARLPIDQARVNYDKMQVVERIMQDNDLADAAKEAKELGLGKWFDSEIKPNFETYGHLYEVDIPDETIDKMLDWDAPLSEQLNKFGGKTDNTTDLVSRTGSPSLEEIEDVARLLPDDVRYAVEQMGGLSPHSTGAEFYHALSEAIGQKQASEFLNQAGIPGIRYFDGSSRKAGEGTRNIVVFDESVINKVKRDGEEVFNRIGK